MIDKKLNDFGFNITNKESESFELFIGLLQEWSLKTNITSIKNRDDILIKHIIDSLAVVKHIDISGKIVDIGSGAGFPGIPIKIIKPSLQVTLVESKRKKANFLRHAIRKLGLQNIDVYNGRAEVFEKKLFFDYAISRAFSNITNYCNIASPLVKKDGFIIAMLGKEACAEEKSLEGSGYKIAQQVSFDLPQNRGSRTIVVLRKCFT